MRDQHYLETLILRSQRLFLSEEQNLPVLGADSWVSLYQLFQMESIA